MATHKIYVGNNNDEIKVSLGDIVIIELPENPTTGYQWESVNLNTDVIREKQNSFISSNAGIGAGGMRQIEFEIILVQPETVVLQNAQKWSNDVFQYFTVKLSI